MQQQPEQDTRKREKVRNSPAPYVEHRPGQSTGKGDRRVKPFGMKVQHCHGPQFVLLALSANQTGAFMETAPVSGRGSQAS
jgi:hypothetical protein